MYNVTKYTSDARMSRSSLDAKVVSGCAMCRLAVSFKNAVLSLIHRLQTGPGL